MNIYMHPFFPDKTKEGVKYIRTTPSYKRAVEDAITELRQHPPALSDHHESSGSSDEYSSAPEQQRGDNDGDAGANSASGGAAGESAVRGPAGCHNRFVVAAIELVSLALTTASPAHRVGELATIAGRLASGADVSKDCCRWLKDNFPPPRKRENEGMRCSEKQPEAPHRSRARMRSRAYAIMQTNFEKNMSRTVHDILDGDVQAKIPSMNEMREYWEPVLTTPSVEAQELATTPARPDLACLGNPISLLEVDENRIPLGSAAGIDGITMRQWRSVPVRVRALFYNIIMGMGGFPREMLVSRTVFVPKKDNATRPADFRPISVASVPVRQLHKIMAARLMGARLIDPRQGGLEDGCAENITIFATLLEDSRQHLRPLHAISMDIAKAFDSVSHKAITSTLKEAGLPSTFVDFITNTYSRSSTVLQVNGVMSQPISVLRGVRQGDPLSSPIFCLVVDRMLRVVPSEVGYDLLGTRVNATAYADDLVLIATSNIGMQRTITAVEEVANEQGLTFNPQKCSALSILPVGKQKKYKILTTPQFHLGDGSLLKQLGPSEEIRYLGVNFTPRGVKKAGGSMTVELERITRAPLRPQQRLKILRCFLIPRWYHRLVLAGCHMRVLKALDRQVRLSVRKWLRLPKDVPVAYFHTDCNSGGLGIPSLVTTIPGLLHARMTSLATSTCAAAVASHQHPWVQKRLIWAKKVLTIGGEILTGPEKRSKWWATKLYRSCDGNELRECRGSSLSNKWIDHGSYGIPGRDYIQYHHVHINCLPTKIRTSRGRRNTGESVSCRAGCHSTETAAHIIQVCHRTHGGRIMRHNALCKVLANGMRQNGWTVQEEPYLRTSIGLRKPDLLAMKNGNVEVIDAQVVSGSSSLNEAHRRKVLVYNNSDVKATIANEYKTPTKNIVVSSCTISWRGVWATESANHLMNLGLSKGLLAALTTRVLQGSHTNWTRWNKMTSMFRGSVGVRRGVG